jgi:hypothetical protein
LQLHLAPLGINQSLRACGVLCRRLVVTRLGKLNLRGLGLNERLTGEHIQVLAADCQHDQFMCVLRT